VPRKLQITTVSYRRCVRAGSAYYLVEGTGALGPAVSPFIKQVSQEAKTSGSCSSAPAFRRYGIGELDYESDDSTDSEHSSDDDTASADSDGGSDSDESDGA